ncbi:MAG: SUMF1/EgtB/PvdO family nonheme iron enzyme [Polyangiaceae bacterium]|nr:SUMF1/EgtB/PvdO family nonheme iron enzyme [Polyangiaceae bacterium]
MNSRTIVQIAFRAFDKGYIDTRALHDAILEGSKSDWVDPDQFWKARMTKAHYDELRREVLDEQDAPRVSVMVDDDAAGDSVHVTIGSFTPELLRPAVAPAPLPTRGRPAVAHPTIPAPPPAQQAPAPAPPVAARTARFARLGILGTGGMGEVVEYEDTHVGRRVAVKSLRADLGNRTSAEALLEREARITGGLEHPNIIPVYDAGRDPVRGPFFMMRVLKEPPLNEVLRKLRAGDAAYTSRYTLPRLLRAFVQVCHAVDYAHSRGIVHCDLKPANILLGPFGEVLVVDWGFAIRMNEPVGHRGGTPGYMSPEQLDAKRGRIDGRSDVFALGAILYELLTLRKAFPARPMNEFMDAIRRGESVFPRPRDPDDAAPDRAAPRELVDVCMRAIELEQDKRYFGARDLADAIDAFLEGTKERERRQRRAEELTDQGDGLAESFRELEASRPERLEEVAELARRVAPWAPPEEKHELWDAEDRQTVIGSLCIRTFQAAVSAYEHALDEVPGHARARRGLADLYWGELSRAHERRDDFDRIYFEGMVHQYDDGTYADRLKKAGSLYVECRPGGGQVVLEHFAEVDRRLRVSREEPLGPAPARAPMLEPGSYVVRLDRPDTEAVRFPVLVKAGEDVLATVSVAGASTLLPGEVFIPAGPALLGGHESSALGREARRVEIDEFILSTLPVSFDEYLEFLEALRATDPTSAARLLPRTGDGGPYWEWEGPRLAPRLVKKWGKTADAWRMYPAFGVDLDGARAYAAWRAARTGRAYRLPTEAEWEKAGRGADGRAYPWGDRFDPSFAKVRASRPGAPSPEPSGTFSADVSPFGVRDLAGGIAEWCEGPTPVSRGGAWCDWSYDCHLASRREYAAGERSERVGFRLAR